MKSVDVANQYGLSVDQVKRIRKRLGLSRQRSQNKQPEPNLFLLVNKLMRPVVDEQHAQA